MAGAMQPASPSLLGLPAELRNLIFGQLLLRPYSITISSNMDDFLDILSYPESQTARALSAVNKQARNEVLPLFLGGNTLEIYMHNTFPWPSVSAQRALPIIGKAGQWIRKLSAQHRALMKEVVLCTSGSRIGVVDLALMLNHCFELGSSCCEGFRLTSEVDDQACAANSICNAGLIHYGLRVKHI
jgi:hypothetical protein